MPIWTALLAADAERLAALRDKGRRAKAFQSVDRIIPVNARQEITLHGNNLSTLIKVKLQSHNESFRA
jgi:hypothetical protein